jgi:ketosteroid isomerase-like protein
MKAAIIALAAGVALAACSAQSPTNQPAAAAAQRPSDAETDAYMRKAEEDWAALALKKDPALLARILADDYVGVSSDNSVRSKAKQIELESSEDNSALFASTKLDYVHYRHFGDTVIAQGGESLKWRAAGKPDLSLIWTDVWMSRDGKWQVVASQDSVLPAKK